MLKLQISRMYLNGASYMFKKLIFVFLNLGCSNDLQTDIRKSLRKTQRIKCLFNACKT